MAYRSITPLTALPNAGVLPSDPSLANKTLHLGDYADEILIAGLLSAGSGTAQLGVFLQEANGGSGRWYNWAADASTGGWGVDSTKNGGLFQVRLQKPIDLPLDVVVVMPAGSTVTECLIAQQRSSNGR